MAESFFSTKIESGFSNQCLLTESALEKQMCETIKETIHFGKANELQCLTGIKNSMVTDKVACENFFKNLEKSGKTNKICKGLRIVQVGISVATFIATIKRAGLLVTGATGIAGGLADLVKISYTKKSQDLNGEISAYRNDLRLNKAKQSHQLNTAQECSNTATRFSKLYREILDGQRKVIQHIHAK